MSSSPPWPISFDLWLGEGRQATDAEGTQSSNSVMVPALAAQRLKHSKFKGLQFLNRNFALGLNGHPKLLRSCRKLSLTDFTGHSLTLDTNS